MRKTTPIFPGFHLQSLRRKPRSAQHKLADEVRLLRRKNFKQLGEIFGRSIPANFLKPNASGKLSRNRFYSKDNVFWAFFSQVIDCDGGCKEVVKKLQAYASAKGTKVPSSSTASYCTARKNLDEEMINKIFEHTANQLVQMPEAGVINDRRVVVVDGTGISMPDTESNQEEWPQSATQKPGCGFPTARICACFCLQTGALISYRIGNKKSHELPLLRDQMNNFNAGDVFLGDKGFCSYFDITKFKGKGVDSVITLARRTPVTQSQALKVFAPNDLLITWKRPAYQKGKMPVPRDEWKKLPNLLKLRQIKVSVSQPGFRVKEFYIVTTLLDPVVYPAEEIADLYFQRWDVELFFRDIKTTMNMDVLRCLTPEMIRKEIRMYFIAYNCIRRLMYEASEEAGIPVRLISFKGSLQSLRNWEPHLNQAQISESERFRMLSDLYDSITNVPIRQRPGRREPRCIKRRPKPFQNLTAPRHEMKEILHKSQYRAKQA